MPYAASPSAGTLPKNGGGIDDSAMVWIDGQNLFHRAKAMFGCRAPDFDVRRLAGAMCQRLGVSLSKVYFYSGIPSPQESPHWHHYWATKLDRIAEQGGPAVECFTPELRYRNEWQQRHDGTWQVYRCPQEKGVDVQLALDMVAAVYERRCSTMVLFSEDADLQQAVDRCLKIADEQGRSLRVVNAMPYDPGCTLMRRGLRHTEVVRFDQAFYERQREGFTELAAHRDRQATEQIELRRAAQAAAVAAPPPADRRVRALR